MAAEGITRRLQDILFADGKLNVFAVLDGASIPELRDRLYTCEPDHWCLYRGKLEPDMAEVAPYLVALRKRQDAFTKWLLTEGWGNHWGIFAVSSVDLRKLRQHFRRFLMVQDPEGKSVYFRYYDPRVLRIYLPTCNAEDVGVLFGPVAWYAFEAEDPATLVRCRPADGDVQREEINLTEGLT